MGRVRCNYCGSFIDDSLPNCPHCGAVNDYMIRFSETTPKTIEELAAWYAERNLPPEEVTRFFIGKDIREPRAFGIYEKDGKFTVYKNKSDGTRAIRYQGSDEAYAVNEIYMKLKEEILNQKNRNLTKAPARSNLSHEARYRMRRQGESLFRKLWRIFIIFMVLGVIGSFLEEEPLPGGYYSKGDPQATYYLYGGNNREWWKYDKDMPGWAYFETFSENDFPPGIGKNDSISYADAAGQIGSGFSECTSSPAFIDQHHPSARPGYYILDNSLYYYLDDYYGTGSGWYSYDNGSWDYYTSGDDKDSLEEALWYDPDSCYASSEYSGLADDQGFYYQDNEAWNADFSDTPYYESYLEDLSEYSSSVHDSDSGSGSWDSGSDWDSGWSSWDNDSSWDWDSGSDWDSGWSSWDSDW